MGESRFGGCVGRGGGEGRGFLIEGLEWVTRRRLGSSLFVDVEDLIDWSGN